MRKKIEFVWEQLDNFTCRAKVIGGWVLQMQGLTNKGSSALTSVFIADRDHEWHVLRPENVVQA